ncbi:MAG: iron-sulfur cluster assembly protein [Planctomycetaceae bacterium]
MMERLIDCNELQPGQRESVFVDDVPALVCRLGNDYFVIEDVCSHDGQPLTDGPITDGAIACPRHGAKFDLKTGAALCMPATKAIRTFRTEIRDGAIWADSSPASATARPAAVKPAPATVSLQVDNPASSPNGGVAVEPGTDTPKAPSTETDFIEALKQVIDPELMINVVDLGLIYTIQQADDNDRHVQVEMTLTSPACPAGPQLVQQSKMALERLHDVDQATITLVMSPPWTPERMTDEARDQLGIF